MKVSIIVPIFNSEEYLTTCLDSLVKQTYKNIEIILIDDGSFDSSLEIAKKYQQKYNNIIIIEQENHGQGYARNRGIEVSSGDAITFVDSDDYIDINMIEVLIENLKDSDIAICNISKLINKSEEKFINYVQYGNDRISFMLSHPGPVAKLYKKEVLKGIQFKDNLYYEDLLYTVEVSKNVKKVSYVNECLYFYVIHDNSIMHKRKYSKKLEDIFEILDYVKTKLNDYPNELEYLYIEHLLYSATLRFIDFKEGKSSLEKITEIMKDYPNWKNNTYLSKKSKKFKLVCLLSSKKQYRLLKILKRIMRKK